MNRIRILTRIAQLPSPTQKTFLSSLAQVKNQSNSLWATAEEIPMSNDNDIEELHRKAVQQHKTTYIDPGTGFTVFTEITHLKRGTCCGSACRHCPFGWENVEGNHREAALRSGDLETAQRLLREIGIEHSHNPKPKSKQPPKTAVPKIVPEDKGRGGRHGGTLTTKNVPYTRKGDKGTSQLLTGESRAKDDDAFEAMGTVDELASVVGTVHAQITRSDDYGPDFEPWLLDIMSRLFDLGSHVAKPRKPTRGDFRANGVGDGFDAYHTEQLEAWIDVMTETLPELTSFILPTGGVAAAHLHVARTVCRRAERRVLPLVSKGVCDPNAMQYLNRLSDFFFTAARFTNYCEHRDEILYKKAHRRDKQRERFVVNLKSGDGSSSRSDQ